MVPQDADGRGDPPGTPEEHAAYIAGLTDGLARLEDRVTRDELPALVEQILAEQVSEVMGQAVAELQEDIEQRDAYNWSLGYGCGSAEAADYYLHAVTCPGYTAAEAGP